MAAGGSTIENSNIGATVEVSNFESFDLEANSSPLITIAVITTIYI
jgi:hypothetical protein